MVLEYLFVLGGRNKDAAVRFGIADEKLGRRHQVPGDRQAARTRRGRAIRTIPCSSASGSRGRGEA
jgi:hypothetical protein